MAEFNNSAMTRWGNMAAAQAMTGLELKFTRIALGDGMLPEMANVEEMTELVNDCADIEVTRIKTYPENTANIGGTYINDRQEHGFWWRELGLFAIMPETGEEVLFAYANAGERAEWIPATDVSTAFEKRIDMFVYVGSRAMVNVEIIPDSFVTHDELDVVVRAILGNFAYMEDADFLAAVTTEPEPEPEPGSEQTNE